MIINLLMSSCKAPIIILRFERNLNFLERFSQNIKKSNFMKIRAVGAKEFHTNRQTDRHDEANNRFS
jgi:hypothetical protein